MGAIEHVFVLMLENRSFDHMLGMSQLTGTDALTDQPTAAHGLTDPLPDGSIPPVPPEADYALMADPKHSFAATLQQLCGSRATYPSGGAYPAVNNSGFASSWTSAYGSPPDGKVPTLSAYRPTQLPVLNQLAQDFAVCDQWFSSMPGPTWPNRFFAHAASSAGLDDSPSGTRALTSVFSGYHFANGTIFDRLENSWCVVEGGALPVTLAMEGMLGHAIEGRLITFHEFLERLTTGALTEKYVFVEPHYGHILLDGSNFKCGNSQHPLDDVTRGERLIKVLYEAIRKSKYWETSALVVLYDEHGGFYDHVAPPAAVSPGDTTDPSNGAHGFTFTQLGVRVPAVVVSPLVRKGVIDHTVYDHSSLVATLSRLFGLGSITDRDRGAASFEHLLSLTQPRSDTPETLPDPADSRIQDCEGSLAHRIAGEVENLPAEIAERPLDEAMVGFLHVAMLRDAHLTAIEGTNLLTAIERKTADLERTMEPVLGKAAGYIRGVQLGYERWRSGF